MCSQYKDKILSYHYNGNPYTKQDDLYIETVSSIALLYSQHKN